MRSSAVVAQHLTGEVERAADQHPGSRIGRGDGGECCRDRGGGGGAGKACGTGGGLGHLGGLRVRLLGDGDRGQALRDIGERAHVARLVLGVDHAADQMRRSRGHARQCRRHRGPARRVVPAVEPQLDPRHTVGQRAAAQPLHPGGPFGAGNRRLAGPGIEAQQAQRGNRGAGVLDLMRAGQHRQRQIKQPGLVLIDQPAALLEGMPVLAMHEERRADPGGAGLDHLERRLFLRADDAGHAALQDPGLLAGDLGQGFAQKGLMVDRDRGDDGQRRPRDHIRRIEPAAEPDLEQGEIGRRAGEGQEGRGGGDLEEGDRGRAVHLPAFLEQRGKRGFRDQRAGKADALVEAGEMGRGIGVHALARRLEPGADHRLGRALAVGAGDVDHRGKHVLGVAEGGKQALDPVEGEVDHLRVQCHQLCQDRVGGKGRLSRHRGPRNGRRPGALPPDPRGICGKEKGSGLREVFDLARGGQVAGDGGGEAHQHAGDRDQLLAQFLAVGDAVEHAVVEQVFGALEALGQLLADRLFDHARAGKADQRIRFRDLHVAEHGIGRRDAARRRVGEHDDIGQVRFLQHLHRNGGARHLHQAEDAFLHPRAAGGGKEDQRALCLHRAFGRGDDGIADIHPHRAAHEGEVLRGGDDRGAAHLALGDEHRLFLAGRFLRGAHPVGVFLLVAELQRVGDRLGHLDLGEDAAVEQRGEARARRDRHVVVAVRADVQVLGQLAVEQHGPAFGALGPQVLGHLAAREQRVDLRFDVVRDPVHRS
ncbi:hypothetical protein SDC9_06379 [bioreactor metagenome]|uniref:Uncharacterized protein n=1 Tax=bioreactor metagenome TaxID=1076179 RepID=A0A644T2U5_9ZZZZ